MDSFGPASYVRGFTAQGKIIFGITVLSLFMQAVNLVLDWKKISSGKSEDRDLLQAFALMFSTFIVGMLGVYIADAAPGWISWIFLVLPLVFPLFSKYYSHVIPQLTKTLN